MVTTTQRVFNWTLNASSKLERVVPSRVASRRDLRLALGEDCVKFAHLEQLSHTFNVPVKTGSGDFEDADQISDLRWRRPL
jgi:hypothetical protein